MREIGLPQPAPTVIYCDNKPAIQIMENKGALGKRSKAMDIQIYALRDRIVDQEVQLEHCPTEEMVADVGTKALGKTKFTYFRDLVTGCALTRTIHEGVDTHEMGEVMRMNWREWKWEWEWEWE